MTTHPEPHEGMLVDGYRLIRPLGQGGFGVVWLAFSEASQSHHALKWVSGSQGTLETELSALRHFREISQRLRSPNLIPVEHINQLPGALYYTLPLADGAPGNDPTRSDWRPFTLADYIAEANETGVGLSTEQIISVFEPVARAAALLNKEGLVHRDIKPANILFFNGEPCLSDIGLVGRDGDSISMRGTPGYMPPSWFVESSGETDMWGLATTLYSLLTGQNPDKMGKARFRQPVGGFDRMTSMEQREWKRLYKVIDKATDENPLERFLSLEAFADALNGLPKSDKPAIRHTIRDRILTLLGVIVVGVLAVLAKGVKYSEHELGNVLGPYLSHLIAPALGMAVIAEHNDAAKLKQQVEALKKQESITANTEKIPLGAPRSNKSIDINAGLDGSNDSLARSASKLERAQINFRHKMDEMQERAKNEAKLKQLKKTGSELGYEWANSDSFILPSSLSGDADIEKAKQIISSGDSDSGRVNQIITLAAKVNTRDTFASIGDILVRFQDDLSQKGEDGVMLSSKISAVLDELTLAKARIWWTTIPDKDISQYLLKEK